MTPDQYAALAEAVERGLYRGWDRVHEHTPQPRKRKLLDALLAAVMADLEQLIDICNRPEHPHEH